MENENKSDESVNRLVFCSGCGNRITKQPFYGFLTSDGEYHWCCSIECFKSEIHKLAERMRREENRRIEYIC